MVEENTIFVQNVHLMGIPNWLAYLVITLYVLYVTRPSEADLNEQILAKGDLQIWPMEILQNVLTKSPFDRQWGMLETKKVSDYGLITAVWEPRTKGNDKDVFLVGFLSRFMVLRRQYFKWTREHDVLLAIGLHIFLCALA